MAPRLTRRALTRVGLGALAAPQLLPDFGQTSAPAAEADNRPEMAPGRDPSLDDVETWSLHGMIGYRRSTGRSEPPYSTPTELFPGMVIVQRIGHRWYIDGSALNWEGGVHHDLFRVKGEPEG